MLLGQPDRQANGYCKFCEKGNQQAPLFFVEIWYWDETENTVVGGHAGPQDPNVALPGTAWISPDYEYAQADAFSGAHLQFVARPGPVTLFQMRCILYVFRTFET
jgi:hypothetical protein